MDAVVNTVERASRVVTWCGINRTNSSRWRANQQYSETTWKSSIMKYQWQSDESDMELRVEKVERKDWNYQTVRKGKERRREKRGGKRRREDRERERERGKGRMAQQRGCGGTFGAAWGSGFRGQADLRFSLMILLRHECSWELPLSFNCGLISFIVWPTPCHRIPLLFIAPGQYIDGVPCRSFYVR